MEVRQDDLKTLVRMRRDDWITRRRQDALAG